MSNQALRYMQLAVHAKRQHARYGTTVKACVCMAGWKRLQKLVLRTKPLGPNYCNSGRNVRSSKSASCTPSTQMARRSDVHVAGQTLPNARIALCALLIGLSATTNAIQGRRIALASIFTAVPSREP